MTRPRLAWIPIVGLVINTAVWACLIVDRSGRRPSYPYGAAPVAYPTDEVLVWIGAMVVELAATAAVLWRTSSVPKACAILAVGYGAVFVAMLGLGAMHIPPALAGHIVALGGGAAWLLLAAIITGAIAAIQRAVRSPS